jgi:hypothetical protein
MKLSIHIDVDSIEEAHTLLERLRPRVESAPDGRQERQVAALHSQSDVCPIHKKVKQNSRGLYCPVKLQDGIYCGWRSQISRDA